EPAAHNGLVAGSSPAGPTTHSPERRDERECGTNVASVRAFVRLGPWTSETETRGRRNRAIWSLGLKNSVPGARIVVGWYGRWVFTDVLRSVVCSDHDFSFTGRIRKNLCSATRCESATRRDELTDTVRRVPHHGCREVREDAGHGRQVAGPV